MNLTISVLPEKLCLCKMSPTDPIPVWAIQGDHFFSITKTENEFSVVCTEEHLPKEAKAEKGWKAIKIIYPSGTNMGMLSELIIPLVEMKIPVFAISTCDAEYLLVKDHRLDNALVIFKKFCGVDNE